MIIKYTTLVCYFHYFKFTIVTLPTSSLERTQKVVCYCCPLETPWIPSCVFIAHTPWSSRWLNLWLLSPLMISISYLAIFIISIMEIPLVFDFLTMMMLLYQLLYNQFVCLVIIIINQRYHFLLFFCYRLIFIFN